MHKLQRVVDGYSLQIVTLPKIFSRLAHDLPSGAIALPNGETAYYRIQRVPTDNRKTSFKSPREAAPLLVDALQAIIGSTAFLNQYGLVSAPQLPNVQQLTIEIRNLLTQNQNTVEYRATTRSNGPGKGHSLIEEIAVPLSNLVHFHAIRGGVMRAKGENPISGTLFLRGASVTDEGYKFKIFSPFVNLAEYSGPDRIAEEILTKLRKNLVNLVQDPAITFDEDQFSDFVARGLASLETKRSNKSKKASAEGAEREVLAVGPASILTEEQYRSLSQEVRAQYLQGKADLPNLIQTYSAEQIAKLQKEFLQSGVLALEYRQHSTSSKANPLTQEYFLARKIGMTDQQVVDILGADAPKFINQLDSSVPVGDKEGDAQAVKGAPEAGSVEDFADKLLNGTTIHGECKNGACELPTNGPGRGLTTPIIAIEDPVYVEADLPENLATVLSIDKILKHQFLTELEANNAELVAELAAKIFGTELGRFIGHVDTAGQRLEVEPSEGDYMYHLTVPLVFRKGTWTIVQGDPVEIEEDGGLKLEVEVDGQLGHVIFTAEEMERVVPFVETLVGEIKNWGGFDTTGELPSEGVVDGDVAEVAGVDYRYLNGEWSVNVK